MEPSAHTAERAFLPPVTVVYTGKLSQFADLVPTVSAGSLERELVVRKMELDVGELERLRKLDEQRARDDAVRRKAQDEEQARIEAERRKALEADQERTAPPAIAPNGLPPVNVVAASEWTCTGNEPVCGAGRRCERVRHYGRHPCPAAPGRASCGRTGGGFTFATGCIALACRATSAPEASCRRSMATVPAAQLECQSRLPPS